MRISDWSSDVCSSDLDPAKLDPETAILVLLTRRMIMCGRNVSWEKPAAGEVEALLATIELPAQDREEIRELDWQRAVAPHPQWLQDNREPGYHPDPMDAVILRLMVEEKLGRPSTSGRLANKIFPSHVIDPDFGKIGRASCRERVCQYV